MPGFPLNTHSPAPNRIVTGLFALMLALQVCVGVNPRASTVPPCGGRAPMAALICAQGSDCGKCAGFGIPLAVCTDSVVKLPLFGVTLPMGGGEERFPPPPAASTYALFAASVGFCGAGTDGELANVFTPLTTWSDASPT